MTRIGVLGAGQLGRMLGLAGIPLGLEFRFLDPADDPPAAAVGSVVRAPFHDADALDALAEWADVVTYEFENIPISAARRLAARVPLWPPAEALEASQDRLVEKKFFRAHGIPTAPFRAVDGPEDLRAALQEIGFPAVLKTRRMGYDGKGQRVLREGDDPAVAWDALGPGALILEGFVPFRREVSSIAVRAESGAIAFYALSENVHRDGILRRSSSPASPGTPIEAQAVDAMSRLMSTLNYVGVLTVEWFETDDGLVANEMAPRVHNSGHSTIEGAETSQFENHVRAVAGLPLGSCAPRGYSGMINIVGVEPPPESLLVLPAVHLHRYGKAPRAGRKLGHATVRRDARAERDADLDRLDAAIP